MDPKLSNNRHRYTIAVQDKIFKIKKNPYYQRKKKRNNESIVAAAQELLVDQDHADSN
jgi:hypothetical protein